MNAHQAVSDCKRATWDRVSKAIRDAVDANPWDEMPTVLLQTFEAQCKREAEVMIADGSVVSVFPKLEAPEVVSPMRLEELSGKLEKLYGPDLHELLHSYLFCVDREGLEGEVASTIADTLAILYAVHREWKEAGRYFAPTIAYTLWHLETFDDSVHQILGVMDASIRSVRMYYDHKEGPDEAEKTWLRHSISRKPGLMQRMESIGELSRTEPGTVLDAFLLERDLIDISSLETIALATRADA